MFITQTLVRNCALLSQEPFITAEAQLMIHTCVWARAHTQTHTGCSLCPRCNYQHQVHGCVDYFLCSMQNKWSSFCSLQQAGASDWLVGGFTSKRQPFHFCDTNYYVPASTPAVTKHYILVFLRCNKVKCEISMQRFP